MNYILLVATCLFFGTLTQANLLCNCGLGKGRDACVLRPACAPLVIRPQTLSRIDFTNKPKVVCNEVKPVLNLLSPIGDLCSCTNTIVKPAVVPQPKCAGCNKITGQSSQTASASSSNTLNTVVQSYGGSNAAVPQPPTFGAPADPVSIQIALALQNQANQACVTESSLAFGFRSLPQDVHRKNPNKITEDDLNNVKGDIVELKPVRTNCGKTLEEEAEDDLRQDEYDPSLQEAADIKQLSYGEIGYGPAHINAANFIQVAGSSGTVSAATASNTNTKGVGFSNTQCSNGFVPGQVVINQVPNGQAFETTNTKQNCKLFASDEDDDGTVAIRYPTFKYTSSVASSSCSSSNSKTSNSFFEKLGCN